MESLINQLGPLLLRAIPTVILLIIVHLYLKTVFFKPLQGVLNQRREATEGAREAGQESLKRAAEKAAMYDIALKEARAEMYREQEETRRRWLDHQTSRIDEARHRTHAMIQEATHGIAAEVEAAKRDLASSSQVLALQIVETLAGSKPR